MLIYILLPFILLVFAEQSITYARDALKIWGTDVVPSLFPYMVLSRLVSLRMKEKGIPAFVCVPILGLLGGSPSGAAAIVGYASHLTHAQLHALCALCGTISPMFFLGTVSRWYASHVLGKMLLAAHLGGALLCSCMVYAFDCRRKEAAEALSSPVRTIDDADPVQQCITAILNIGASIVISSVAAGLFSAIPGTTDSVRAWIHALMEAAGGIHNLSQLSIAQNHRAYAASAAAGFSGLSILYQNLIFLKPLGIRIRHLVAYGLIRMVLSTVIMLTLVQIGYILL